MDFQTMEQELSDRLAAYDSTISTDKTRLDRWLNMGYQYICSKYLWPFMINTEIIQTETDYTTGTVSTTVGLTSITFSGVISTSKTGYYVQFSDSKDWYKITAHTAGSASATISPAAINTNATATFTITKLLYSSATPLDSILDMKQMITPTNLRSIDPRTASFFLPLYFSSGPTYNYILASADSSGGLQFSLFYRPSAVLNLMVRGVRTVPTLSAASDVPIFPARWHDATVDVAAYYGFKSLDDNRSTTELQAGELKIETMARVFNPDLGRHRVMKPSVNSENWGPAIVFPGTYGAQEG